MLPPPPITGMPVGNLALAIAIQKATERSAHFLGKISERCITNRPDGFGTLPFHLSASGTALFAYDWALTLSDDVCRSISICSFLPMLDRVSTDSLHLAIKFHSRQNALYRSK